MSKIDYNGSGVLYITNITTARKYLNEDNKKIDVIITVCQDSIIDSVSDKSKYHFYCMADGVSSGNTSGSYKYDLFEEAADTLFNALSSDKRVLIHCHAGQSRSVSVSVAALGRLLNKPRSDVLDIIYNHRNTFQEPSEVLIKHADDYIEKHTGIEPPFKHYK